MRRSGSSWRLPRLCARGPGILVAGLFSTPKSCGGPGSEPSSRPATTTSRSSHGSASVLSAWRPRRLPLPDRSRLLATSAYLKAQIGNTRFARGERRDRSVACQNPRRFRPPFAVFLSRPSAPVLRRFRFARAFRGLAGAGGSVPRAMRGSVRPRVGVSPTCARKPAPA